MSYKESEQINLKFILYQKVITYSITMKTSVEGFINPLRCIASLPHIKDLAQCENKHYIEKSPTKPNDSKPYTFYIIIAS